MSQFTSCAGLHSEKTAQITNLSAIRSDIVIID